MNARELAENPFYVLELPATATRMEVERAGQKLLAQLAIGVSAVKTYRTPFGERSRDESTVRAALAALRDPQTRASWEVWLAEDVSDTAPPAPAAWPSALRSIGWSRR